MSLCMHPNKFASPAPNLAASPSLELRACYVQYFNSKLKAVCHGSQAARRQPRRRSFLETLEVVIPFNHWISL